MTKKFEGGVYTDDLQKINATLRRIAATLEALLEKQEGDK